MHNENQGVTKLQSMGWIIDARWYYAPLAFVLGMIGKDEVGYGATAMILAGSLAFVFLANGYFAYFLRHKRDEELSSRKLNLLNICQIAIDLVFFFIVMVFTGGGVASVGHSFLFIPIIVSTIIFGFRGAILVAIASGLLVLFSVLVHNETGMMHLASGSFKGLAREFSVALTQGAIIMLIYLMTAFFGGYIARLIRARDILLMDQIEKGAEHVKLLEELTQKFDQSAKLLVRRDLELTSANDKLTQLDQMKSDIISVVAHQLRTPLSAIKWTLKILLDEDAGKITPEQKELLTKGFDSNERMIILINDMLAVDRLESGRLKFSFVPVQFEELVQDMIRSLIELATQKNIRVDYVPPSTPLPKAKIDPDKMRDVLQNLIDNAIKYTREGGVITVGVSAEGEDIHFWVKDNGIGIPDGEKGRIFSRFFRAENAVHQETDGSGLGLYIAASVVKRHGGKLWFDSVLNEGSTFHVTFPISAS